jgi:ubiquinol-cytochrome c reductase cytochrome c subunit
MRLVVAAAVLALALPGAATAADRGADLYAESCSRCHGTAGAGTGDGPSLRGVGAQAADFYLRTGYMPLSSPGEQPQRHDVRFDEQQLRELIAYVASLGDGPPVPRPHPERGSVAEGMRAFAEHCAGCHQIATRGGYLTGGVAPALDEATPTQIAEAVRIGPYLMPSFPRRAIDDRELDSVVAYVEYARNPEDPGGWPLGRIGPVPEGMVAWLLAGSVLVGCCLVIGRRVRA